MSLAHLDMPTAPCDMASESRATCSCSSSVVHGLSSGPHAINLRLPYTSIA